MKHKDVLKVLKDSKNKEIIANRATHAVSVPTLSRQTFKIMMTVRQGQTFNPQQTTIGYLRSLRLLN